MKGCELIKAHALYESKYGNNFYKLALKVCKRGGSEEKALSIVAFLLYFNQVWYTQNKDGRKAFDDLERHVSNVVELIRATTPILDELEGIPLLEADLDDAFINDSIKILFRRYSEVFGATGASKALHLLLPQLIVMWDGSIRERYGVQHNEEGYLTFLSKAKEDITDFLRGYSEEHNLDMKGAEQEVMEKAGVELTKLIDELNYLIFTRKELPDKKAPDDKIEWIMRIIDEIVQGAFEASEIDWVVRGGHSGMVKASAIKLRSIVESHAKKGNIEGILSYLFNVQGDATGIRVSKILKACGKRTVEDVYDEIVKISKDC